MPANHCRMTREEFSCRKGGRSPTALERENEALRRRILDLESEMSKNYPIKSSSHHSSGSRRRGSNGTEATAESSCDNVSVVSSLWGSITARSSSRIVAEEEEAERLFQLAALEAKKNEEIEALQRRLKDREVTIGGLEDILKTQVETIHDLQSHLDDVSAKVAEQDEMRRQRRRARSDHARTHKKKERAQGKSGRGEKKQDGDGTHTACNLDMGYNPRWAVFASTAA